MAAAAVATAAAAAVVAAAARAAAAAAATAAAAAVAAVGATKALDAPSTSLSEWTQDHAEATDRHGFNPRRSVAPFASLPPCLGSPAVSLPSTFPPDVREKL